MKTKENTLTQCYHCGDICYEDIHFDEKHFCCQSCQSVYQILSDNSLDSFYILNPSSGLKNTSNKLDTEFSNYDNPEISHNLLHFNSENLAHLNLNIPEIHCSSCVWLLENIGKLNKGIISSEVNFMAKDIFISFNPQETKLSAILSLLYTLGYTFHFKKAKKSKKLNMINKHYIKLAIAGFAFGNVMLLSFPEYFDKAFLDSDFRYYFPLINLLFSIPVLLYSALDYYKSAFQSLKQKKINIDVPITIGIISLFVKSLVDVLILNNVGYFDSFCGFIFFLLIGKTFQMKMYDHLSFENNFESYFPLYVLKKEADKWQPSLIEKLNINDKILIRSNEIIPVDSYLNSESAVLDYRFVSGESSDIKFKKSDFLYAGGKNIGSSIELEVKETVQKSYLINLWNKNDTETSKIKAESITDKIAGAFTLNVIIVASLALIYGTYTLSLIEGLDRFTAVLIVACPCALALSAPFTLGTYSAILSRVGFFFKNTESIESLSKIDSFIFDKTGTLSEQEMNKVEDHRTDKSDTSSFYYLFKQSVHPLSQSIANFISCPIQDKVITNFEEIPGKGIIAVINGESFLAGSRNFLIENEIDVPYMIKNNQTEIHLAKNKMYYGYFIIKHAFRDSIADSLSYFKKEKLYLLSGDKTSNMFQIKDFFLKDNIRFEMSPTEKLTFIQDLQKKHPVAMFGDGLNDSAALKDAAIGISVVDSSSQFTPSSDAIIDGKNISQIDRLIDYVRSSKKVITISFILSFLYNLIGLSYAFTGHLSPIVSAILMPLSSITIISFTVASSYFIAKKKGIVL